jgi:hypothetical protein
MRCKACDFSIEPRNRNVTDERNITHSVVEDLCLECIEASTLAYTEAELRRIYRESTYAPLKIIR